MGESRQAKNGGVVGGGWWEKVDKRRMEELWEEVGGRESLTRKLMRSRLKWAGHCHKVVYENESGFILCPFVQ